MAMTIFNISENFNQIMNEIESNGGEVTTQIDEQLAILECDLQTKSVSYVSAIKHFEGNNTIIDAEIKRLQAMKKANDNVVDRMKYAIKFAMETFGIEKIDLPLNKISFRKSESVEITDESLLPSNCYVMKRMPDKTVIKALIKAGGIFSGAELRVNQNLQIK